jgi:hypothetical protein
MATDFRFDAGHAGLHRGGVGHVEGHGLGRDAPGAQGVARGLSAPASRALSTMRAPAAPSAAASAKPMPLLEPVMRAVRPDRSNSFKRSSLGAGWRRAAVEYVTGISLFRQPVKPCLRLRLRSG